MPGAAPTVDRYLAGQPPAARAAARQARRPAPGAIEWSRRQVDAVPDGLGTMLAEMVKVLMNAEV